jgi:hypothetical protein
MSLRYWVGGTANWDATAGTKWASSSGGVGGASVPTGADDVFFDGSSGSGTVTLSGVSVPCKSLTTTGFTGTVAGSAQLTCNGNLTIAASTTWSHAGDVVFEGSSGGTITTNGNTLYSAVSVFATGTWTLGDALTISNNVLWSRGSFVTANFNVSAKYYDFSGATNVSLGSSTLTASEFDGSNQAWAIDSGVTLSAGTSTIKITDATSATKIFTGAGKTYYNIWFAPGTGTGKLKIAGANTFNDIKDDGTIAHTIEFPAGVTQTVSSFTVSGNSGQLISLRSSSNGSQFTLSKSSGTVTCNYLDIKDSNAAGGASWVPGANSVDSGNNSGWIFPIVYNDNLSETTTVADSQSSSATFPVTRAESSTAVDAQSSSATFQSSLAETATATDSESSSAVFQNSLSEAASAADSQTGTAIISVADSVATSDAQEAVATFVSSVDESSGTIDFESANPSGIVNETSGISDDQSSIATFVDSVFESVAASEQQSAQIVQITGSGVKRLSSAVDAKIDWLLVRQAIEGFYYEAEDLLVTLPEMQGLSPFQRAKLVDAIDSSKMMRAVRRHGVPLTDLYALIDEVKRKKQEEDDEEALYALLDVA